MRRTNTFEGVTLKGKVGFVDYRLGYLTQMKPRNTDGFMSMAEAAGVNGNSGGLVLAGVTVTPAGGFKLELSNQFGNDVSNTAYGRVDYAHAFTSELGLTLSSQYTDQRAVGDDLLGGSKFKSWVTAVGGTRAQLQYQGLTLTASPAHLPGAQSKFEFAQGKNAVSPTKRTPEPDQREYDLTIEYHAPKGSALRGLGFLARGGSILDVQGSDRSQYQIRLTLDYEIPLL